MWPFSARAPTVTLRYFFPVQWQIVVFFGFGGAAAAVKLAKSTPAASSPSMRDKRLICYILLSSLH